MRLNSGGRATAVYQRNPFTFALTSKVLQMNHYCFHLRTKIIGIDVKSLTDEPLWSSFPSITMFMKNDVCKLGCTQPILLHPKMK